MGAVKGVVFEIEEMITDAVCAGDVVTEALLIEIARRTDMPLSIVRGVYDDFIRDNYSDW